MYPYSTTIIGVITVVIHAVVTNTRMVKVIGGEGTLSLCTRMVKVIGGEGT